MDISVSLDMLENHGGMENFDLWPIVCCSCKADVLKGEKFRNYASCARVFAVADLTNGGDGLILSRGSTWLRCVKRY